SFLDQLMESIGIVLNTIAANMRTEGLLKQSQLLTSELQAQQEELKKTNDRLEQQAASLRQSEELLRAKQDELQQTNAELEDKAKLLSVQNQQVEGKNREVEQAKMALEEKAEQLALTSKYKSEFLANMSHELRTPLNSLLILSKMLSENSHGNLTDKQVEFARNIHSAGSDLLGLINDILDLSKIESGTVTLDIGEMSFSALRDKMDRTFAQIAQNKRLDFTIEVDPELPHAMYTDDKRLQQIIKNLLSNAFKFTEQGGVSLAVRKAEGGWNPTNDHLNKAGQVLVFSVKDSGIGIPEDKQRLIFEAFQQADGTTSRKYGGTGLGLSISREITRMLGGELTVESISGEGSIFSLYLPLNFSPAAQPAQPSRPAPNSPVFRITTATASPEVVEAVQDDRDEIEREDSVVLIVEDDPRFAAILLSLVRDGGFKGVVTGEGMAVLSLARRFQPDAIMLDIGLPDMDGLALLDMLKRTPETRHIPVHVISADDQAALGLSLGAYGFTSKPVEREAVVSTLDDVKKFVATDSRRVVFAGVDGEASAALRDAFGEIEIVPGLIEAATLATASNARACVVADVGHAPVSEIIEQLREHHAAICPTVLYASRELDPEDDRRLRLAVFNGQARLARSLEQLIDQTSLLMHAPVERLSGPAQAIVARNRHADALLQGRTAVVIDDDIRNIFSLASALEEYGIALQYAESGRAGLELMDSLPQVDMVLVDIMMPDMDGYETIREIRSRGRFNDLPVIAVTAKAMKGDRQKCIQAGASDYVSKPVDVDQLVSVLRVSLQRVDAVRLASEPVVAPSAG
ncbi:MAG: ATP-binding response regulator, partial [Caulobacteraceae bacterium]